MNTFVRLFITTFDVDYLNNSASMNLIQFLAIKLFENEQEEAVTVYGHRYRAMLNKFLFTKIVEEDIGNFWFQQEGATCHTAEAKLNILLHVFKDRIINRKADVVWPLRSCDLTPLDCYLWSGDKPETIESLKDNICEPIGEIQLLKIDNLLKNWTDCVGYCMASLGNHLNEIIFKIKKEV